MDLRVGGSRSLAGSGIEIIQPHHRYAAVWPSIHPETGEKYRWYVDGVVADAIPDPALLPELPPPWVDFLSAPDNRMPQPVATTAEVRTFVEKHNTERRPNLLEHVRQHLYESRGSRHDALVEHACWAMREAAAAWAGKVGHTTIQAAHRG